MSAAETGSALVRRLLAEIRADRSALDARTQEVRRFSHPTAESTASVERVGALALALDRAYTALESILERIVRTLEGDIPVGPDWHRALLHNASLDIPGVRPPLLRPTTIAAADHLRRFRHLLRHAYAAELDADRLDTLARTGSILPMRWRLIWTRCRGCSR
jgi:hypothetical protein